MPDITDMMAQDATEMVGTPIPRDEDFESIADLVVQQLKLEQELADAEQVVVDKKRELADVQRSKLPEALAKFGMTMFKLEDGRIVDIAEEVRAGITASNLDAALDYLVRTGNDDIIKNDVDLTFGKGQDAEAKMVMDMLASAGFSYKNKKYVHPMTLKSFVRGQLEAGADIPTDIFSIFVEKVAKIKEPKKR